MRQARHILAVALVATALCADRTVATAPQVRPQTAGAAGRLVSRLSVSFQRVVSGVKLYQPRAERFDDAAAPVVVRNAAETLGYRRAFSPIEFSLPPPALS
jgi:hypothetical protein